MAQESKPLVEDVNLMENFPNINQNDENTKHGNLIKYLYSSNEITEKEKKTIQKNQILLKRELEIYQLKNEKLHLKSLQEGYITQKDLSSIQENKCKLLDEKFKDKKKRA
ncbi:18432_t:CDS:2 [Entrophospora sp. SA101]|nr:18432_t:CDS:2 [Entrophospora sp. SA101]